jgi:hypothetical protein
MMLVGHEAFPAEFLGELDLLENLPIVEIVTGVNIGKVSGENVDVKMHRLPVRRGVPRAIYSA